MHHRTRNIESGEIKGSRSFVEVVTRKQRVSEEREEESSDESIRMVVDDTSSDIGWLERSAIGELIDFSKVTQVNERLSDRGFRFSSSYLGGKAVLWTFESTHENEGFIRNGFFWKDTFRSMKKWSESLENQPKSVWINIAGLPLRFWNIYFFQKIGNRFGELLLVESDTLQRKRMDRAQLLVAINGNRPCPKYVKVATGSRPFLVKVEENSVPVDPAWVGKILDLNFEYVSQEMEFLLEDFPEKKGVHENNHTRNDGQINVGKSDRRQGRAYDRQEKKNIEQWVKHERWKEGRGVVNRKDNRSLSSLIEEDEGLHKEKTDVKGKGGYISVARKRPSFPEEPTEGERGFRDLHQGECSKLISKGLNAARRANGLTESPNEEGESSDSPKTISITTMGCENEVFSNPVEGARQMLLRHKEHHLVSLSDKEGRLLSLPLKGPIQLPLIGLRGNLIMGRDLEALPLTVELEGDVARTVSIASTREADRRPEIQRRTSKDKNETGRTTRKNQEESQDENGERTEKLWNLEDEVTKVIEVGIALGLDFNGKETEIGERIARREREDEELMAVGNVNILMIVISWNVRGLGKGEKRRMVRGVVNRHKPEIMFVQESKLKSFPVPWFVAGDFNTILEPSERVGVGYDLVSMRNFHSFITQAGIMDIPMHGPKYTWSNNRAVEAWERLNRFLISPIILSWLPNLMQRGLPRCISDHNPIMLADKLALIDRKAEANGWSDDLRNDRLNTMEVLWRSLCLEEQSCGQKSRVAWLKEGDRNTKFYHCMASSRMRRNLIGEMIIEGNTISDPTRLSVEVFKFFKKHFQKEQWERPRLPRLNLKKNSEMERVGLEEDFSMAKIWTALSSCDGNKSPGPDGFNLNFFKAQWEEIQEDLLGFINEFHKDGSVVKNLNRTFITLIPKVSKPENVKDFRPICLVGYLYKVLAKVLANRLRKVMDSVIGESQMAFISDRQSSDSFVIAEEIIRKWRSDNDGGLSGSGPADPWTGKT
ncbi:hypothetical protein Dsin_007430 [Dipteronia sinensis]|uniref:Reverse transcriptase domain-containing protein n=1 Tax=Dipteronia sinensis TaxID=43782 RepID=A0AAE0B146_9ROSI|nr:hypothetical protein Dsin_007430 [Dipteronia sinensis]